MKIFFAGQIKACDAYTIHASGISSWDLMERAAVACTNWIKQRYRTDTPFVILCGTGNNGGDGLAVARLLLQSGYSVKVFLIPNNAQHTEDNKSNLKKLLQINASVPDELPVDTFLADLPEQVVIIDAILGTGLSRPASGWLAEFITHINHFPNTRISIDIPSGMPADTIPTADTAIIQAHHTLSFQFYKRSFLHPETGYFCGHVHILDIGLHPTFIEATHTHYQTIDTAAVRSTIKPRQPFSYKNTHGHAFLVGGSYGKIGAVALSTMAALRSGAGLVTTLLPECGYEIVQSLAPEAMCHTSGVKYLDAIDHYEKASAIGVGPGMDTKESTVQAFTEFIDSCSIPCVLDADALNILGMHPELMNKIPPNSILTPHPGECRRLFGDSPNSMQQVEMIRMQAMRYNVCIVLKGHHTVVTTPEGNCYYNMTGNAGMAKAGSGDVLTGLLTGLLAQGYDAADAALLGVYLHGVAGDIAAGEQGQQFSMTAMDLISHLDKAWAKS